MSAPFGKNALALSDVTKQMRTVFETFSDSRTGKNSNYKMTDAGLSAFSVFFGSSDSGVINKIVKKQYDIPINHLADSKIITTFLFL